jgi:hypothetical protein
MYISAPLSRTSHVPPWPPSSFYSQHEVEDEYLSLEVRLHIAFDVVSQLGKAKYSMSLSPEELSLRNFLV